MRCDAWADRDYRAAQLRREREAMRQVASLADRTLDAFVARVEDIGASEAEALKWLIAAATKKLEG